MAIYCFFSPIIMAYRQILAISIGNQKNLPIQNRLSVGFTSSIYLSRIPFKRRLFHFFDVFTRPRSLTGPLLSFSDWPVLAD